MASVLWFRRDLRLRDNPALLAAAESGPVVPLFVVDPVLWDRAGAVRQNYLVASLRSLGASLGRNLLLIHGRPEEVVPQIAKAAKADSVHIAADYSPYGQARDSRVEAALGTTPLVRTGSPYAVAPGRVTKSDGTAYRVYTPFYKAWMQHGWRAPAEDPGDIEWWMPVECEGYPTPPELSIELPAAGEDAAWQRWESFRATGLADYAELRNRPDLAGTSSLSQYLRFGEIHPRSLLADLRDTDEVFRKEICWREFYADVLFHNPASTTHSLDARYDTIMRWTTGKQAEEFLEAWTNGMTGFPFVDAGMRQLRDEGWMHNRVRMVVASFLVKDLHLPWQRGAEHFMRMLRDGDVASNSHGWQWTAGCGTDASPFYRVFNPIGQGEKFDPEGDYVRRYIPELSHIPGAAVHQPWNWIDGYAHGYPEPIVDHAHERQVALADFAAIKGR